MFTTFFFSLSKSIALILIPNIKTNMNKNEKTRENNNMEKGKNLINGFKCVKHLNVKYKSFLNK